MAQTVILSQRDIQALASEVSATSTSLNPQAQTLNLAATSINLLFNTDEVVSASPPVLASPQSLASITLDGVKYTDKILWQTRWYEAWVANGSAATKTTPIARTNVVSGTGLLLDQLVTAAPVAETVTVTDTTGTTTTPVYVSAVGVGSVSVNSLGRLIVTYTDLRTSDAGSVVTNISVGTVTQGDVVGATITGTPPNQVLNLVLPTARALGLGNVTNESKVTMFTNPTFTGLTSASSVSVTGSLAITGAKTGAVKINGQKVLTQSQVIALQVGLS
jgi:hypothetical protein